jgi:sphingolipid C9-methyltransferase
MTSITDHVVFNDQKLARKFAHKRIPMAVLYEAYFDGDVDIPGDIYAFLEARSDFVEYSLTLEHFRWAFVNFVPEALTHTKLKDQRIIREHYDRGDDFCEWFLGERMIYTCAFLRNPAESLEQAQDNKMNLVCRKLQLNPGERLLDIGCGWGTLTRHAAKYYGVDATGVTIARNQTEFGNRRIAEWNLQDRARVLCADYRDTPRKKFDKISSLEMVERVGVKNLRSFYDQVYELLDDDGLFLLQWTGLRRGMRPEDMIWIMFMGKYIFPGADASLAPSPMIKAMEKSGFETHSVENVSSHYAWTMALLSRLVFDHRAPGQRRLLSGRAQQEPGRLPTSALDRAGGHDPGRSRTQSGDAAGRGSSPQGFSLERTETLELSIYDLHADDERWFFTMSLVKRHAVHGKRARRRRRRIRLHHRSLRDAYPCR